MSAGPAASSFEIRQVTYFLAVVDHRSVSAAARSLGITQPALARAISRLEQRLGATLLARSSSGTVPTAEGQRFLRHAKMIVNDCRRAVQEVQAVTSGALGNVSIYCGSSFVQELIGEVTERVSDELPALNITVCEGIIDDTIVALLEGRCDVVFSTFPEGPPRGPVVFEPLMTITPTVVAGATHPLAKRRKVSRADLVGHAWASMDQPHTLAVLTDLFAAERLPVPQPLRTNSLTLLKSLVMTGGYLSLLPRHSLRREIRAGLVRRIPVTVPVRRPLAGLIYLDRRARSAALERLLQIVREVCAKQAES